jgi:hypothetical protein
MPLMTTWTKNFTREPAKTKAELREMLAEAIRNTRPELLAEAIHNTRPEPELLDPHPPKIEKDRG